MQLDKRGAIAEIGDVLGRIGVRRPLLLVGPGMGEVAERVRHLLQHSVTGIFSDAVAHVPSWQANLAVASAQEVHADSVISIGGGSTAGYGKIVAFSLRLPWIAIPTTLSGAEMTSRYLVTTDKGKEAGRSSRSAARCVVRDLDLLKGVPPMVLASSGMTAIAECLEVLARPDGHGTANAAAGLQMLWDALPELIANPKDSDLRQAALSGAALAGMALEAAGPGPAQILAEDLGARFRCDHGALMACLVPKAVDSAELIGRFVSTRTPFSTVEDFAQSLTLPVKLADLCPPLDPRALVSRLVSRPDLVNAADSSVLLPILEAAA
ncbi:iron-containing alcohol dehydrogenase [Mycobacterium sp. URHB0021]